ncbi:sensor histidine kinase [Streptomyces naphthomycinicus]|uniref:sensor histidine kinase n=1 Tax=Streptomyces naphthomycinicus TaxID=2872625 RepID=UPI0021F0B08C|nr:sensor histidine kinase [Streptomyces sp. TML10]
MARRCVVRSPALRWPTRLLASVTMVAAMTGVIALLKPHIGTLHPLLFYLLVILPVAMLWGTGLALATSVLSVAVYGYLFVPPLHALRLGNPENLVGLGVFLLTAAVVGQLAARLRRAVWEAERLTEEQSALRRMAELVARSVPPSAVFEAVTREVGLLCGADTARMERYETDGTVTGVAAWTRDRGPDPLLAGARVDLNGLSIARDIRISGRPLRIESFAGAPGEIAREARAGGITSSVGCPVTVRGRLWGVIAASAKGDKPFPEKTEEQIASFTGLVATALENAEARAELTASRARLVSAADETRRRIERDLHDGVQQRLVSLVLLAGSTQALVPNGLNELRAKLRQLVSGLTDASDELREMARGIHPSVLTRGGLVAAIKALARRCPVPVDLVVHDDGELPGQIQVSGYYIVSEALTNVVKHARASAVTVTVEQEDDALCLTVRDDGVGGADFGRGTGLVGIKDRVEALGGRIRVSSPRGAGTTLRVALPLSDRHRPAVQPARAAR